LYWTDIPNIKPPADKGIKLSDIISDKTLRRGQIIGRRINESGCREDYNKNIKIVQCLEVRTEDKSGCLTTVSKDNVLTQLPVGRYLDVYGKNLQHRPLTRTECERLQTVPIGYTNIVSENQAKKMLGNGWTVDVIAHILKGIKE
jgi:site-specific DNA-cytosine methylase